MTLLRVVYKLLNNLNIFLLFYKLYLSILKFGGKDLDGDDVTAETIKKQMTDQEWQKIYQMSKDKNLYQNLINSIFPTIHGEHNNGSLRAILY